MRSRWAAMLILGCVLAAGSARAEPAGASALDHLDRGIAAYRLGDYETAHRELELAQELAPDKPNPYRWLALTEIKQGDCRDAVAHIEAFLSRVPAGDARVPELVAARQDCVAAAQQPVGSTAPVAPPVAPAAPEAAPVYKRWWFWTAIGVAAVAVGVTAIATRGGDDVLPPIRCTAGGCP
nr:hypothetical protein [Kofleriaceae bacterium]